MITELSITNLGTINDVSLSLGPGLTVITGETGAGKTMLISSMKSLLGAKMPAQLICGDKATIVASVILPVGGEILAHTVQECGGILDDDGSALIVRTFSTQGRSKSYLGGQQIPAQTLMQALSGFIAIHGQNDQLRLANRDTHCQLLDKFGGDVIDKHKKEYSQLYREYLSVKTRVEEYVKNSQERAEEVISLQAVVDDINRVQPRDGEEEKLSEKIEQLMLVMNMRDLVMEVIDSIDGDIPIPIALQKSADSCQHSTDVRMQKCGENLRTAADIINDVLGDCMVIASEFPDNDYQLDKLLIRQRDIKNLSKKYYRSINDLLHFYENSKKKLDKLASQDYDIDQLQALVAQYYERLGHIAAELSSARIKAAVMLEHIVTEHLNDLAMPQTLFGISISSKDYGPTGADKVEFYLQRGSQRFSIHATASGGELSRITLALELALTAGTDPITMIFDEIDAGVGGQAALMIGQKLSALSQVHQVLVVTHLPQVAAYAHNHIHVEKTSQGLSAATVLNCEQRVTELARMLAGVNTSIAAQEHARELLTISGQLF